MSVLDGLLLELAGSAGRLQLYSQQGTAVRSSRGVLVQALPVPAQFSPQQTLIVCGQNAREIKQGQAPSSQPAGAGGDRYLLDEALTLMRNNLAEPLTMGEVARYLNVTPKKLERVFRRYGYKLPSRHYLDLRLQHARSLLRNSCYSIDTVGQRCGFNSASHFSRSFRAFAGHTPREERKRWGKSVLPRTDNPGRTQPFNLENRL